MDCHIITTVGQTCFSRLKTKGISRVEACMGIQGTRMILHSMTLSNQPSIGNCPFHHSTRDWKIFCTSLSLEEEFSAFNTQNPSRDDDSGSEASPEEAAKPLSTEELKLLLADSERSKFLKKLSEANQHNRYLKRELKVNEETLVNFRSELAAMEQEIQALVSLAEEIANSGIPEGSRKINGKYIQSHLLSRLEAVQEKMKEQTKDVEAAQPKDVLLFWFGVAESVQVMGSFDGWSQGEHLSPEFTDSYTKFSTTLKLRPGSYEIKFLVDGEWLLSPEFPTVGEGFTENNLLIVE